MRGFFVFASVFPVFACPPVYLALRTNQASITVQQLQMDLRKQRAWSLAAALRSASKASGAVGLDASLTSEAEGLCDFIFLPVIICILILNFIHLLLFCLLQE